MLTEQINTVNNFKLAYEDRKHKNIVLYGTGIHAQAVVSELPGYNIIGLLDAERTGETIWGLPVISLEETLERKVDFIVVAARPAVHGIIYTRIKEFTQKYHIPVYDVYGNLIQANLKDRIKDNQYFDINENDLLVAIEECEAVSFDIFDTLLMRKVLYPRDVFSLLDSVLEDSYPFCFSAERMCAERELSETGSPTLRDIYSRLARKWELSQEKMECLLKMELEMERRVLTPRYKMVDIYEKCLQMGKRVYLVSDMYLPSDILAELLELYHIKGYEKIIVSCEYGCEKRNGLFSILKKELENKKCIHIGDNIEADIEPAGKFDLEAFHIMSGRELLEMSVQDQLLVYTDRLEHRIVLGLYIAKAFNNPFVLYHSKGKLSVGKELPVGYLFTGPIMLAFINWLLKATEEQKIEQILFGSRDGYLIQELYHLYCGLLGCRERDNCYILISRRNASMCTSMDEHDVAAMIGDYRGEKEKRLKNLFGIDKAAGELVSPCESGLDSQVMADIIKQASEERAYYDRYLEQFHIRRENVAFFDFMSRGTCQEKLQKILGHKLTGIYFQKSQSQDVAKNRLDYVSFCDAASAYVTDYAVFQYCDFLETVITDFNPSFYGFNKKGTLIFYPEKRSEEQVSWVKKIQDEILEYAKDFAGIYPKWAKIEFGCVDTILGMIGKQYSVMDTSFEKLSLYDGYSDRHVMLGELFCYEVN